MAHFLIIEARFYDGISDALYEGAAQMLQAGGHTHERAMVPGALEIPAAIRLALDTGRFDGFVALGCVIRGETYHFELVCNESARGLTDLALHHGAIIGNGIITVEDEDQAWVRARMEEKNKGGAAAEAAMALLTLKQQFRVA